MPPKIHISIRLSPTHKAFIEKAASRRQATIAGYMRWVALEAARDDLGEPIPDPESESEDDA